MSSYFSELKEASNHSFQSNRHQEWWTKAQRTHGCLRAFLDAESLVEFFARENADQAFFEQRAPILHVLLADHQAHEGRNTTLLFIAIYFRLFERIGRKFSPRRKGRSLNLEDVGSQVVAAFLNQLANLDASRQQCIHTSLVLNTERDFLRWADREFKQAENRSWVKDCILEDRMATTSFTDANAIACGRVRKTASGDGWELDASLVALDELSRRGVINQRVHGLLVGTMVYRKQLKQVIAESGESLNYEAEKKRLQRAQADIKRYLKTEDLELFRDLVTKPL